MGQWLTCAINRCSNGNEIEYFELLPIACRLERSEQDQELAEICTTLLAMISQALTLVPCMDAALTKIDEISKMTSWSARRSVIDVLQVLVFYNMTIILSNEKWKMKTQEIVLRLLEDNVVEVREKAAEVLCGLLHCSFLTATDELLELFKEKCRTKMIKAKRLKVAASCSNEVAKIEGYLSDVSISITVIIVIFIFFLQRSECRPCSPFWRSRFMCLYICVSI